MNGWTFGITLSVALLAGVGAGWLFGKLTGLHSPNVWLTTLILVAGSLGGPALTYKLMGPGVWAYALALLVAGFAAGFSFWPMGERQGEKEWL